jgi:hypothetical protein
MLGTAAVTVVSGIISSSAAKKRARAAGREKARLQAKLTGLENSRQAIIDPYASIQDLSGLAKDLSGMIHNPFANLGVATQAAKFEAEQQDISLANTLDTLKETGASAGGATALAQAALQGKKGISANIEQQEAQNEKLRAQGEQEMERIKMSEAQRIQNVKMSEVARVQGARAQGAAFVFGAKEDREQQQIDRVSAQLGGAAAQQGQAQADQTAAITGMIGGLTSIAGSAAKAGSTAKTAAGVTGATGATGGFTSTGTGVDTTNPAFQSPIGDQFNNASTTNAWDDYQNLNIGNNRVN